MSPRLLFGLVLFGLNALAQLDVPFLSQVPPPDKTPPESIPEAVAWTHTKNCGQTSVLMVMAYYSHHTISEQSIRDVDNFLQQQFGATTDPINSYYGSVTGGNRVNRLVAIAQSFDHGLGTYPDTTAPSTATLQQLQMELSQNHPVIVGVWTDMCVNCLIRRGKLAVRTVPHWMVLTGLTDSSVYVNDPGHTNSPQNQPKNHQYSLAAFEAAWGNQGNAVVFIHPSSTTGIEVAATLNGSTWPASGTATVNYSIFGAGGFFFSGSTVPTALPNAQPDSYSLVFSSGGPANAFLSNILCPVSGPLSSSMAAGQVHHTDRLKPKVLLIQECTASLFAGQALPFTLQFVSIGNLVYEQLSFDRTIFNYITNPSADIVDFTAPYPPSSPVPGTLGSITMNLTVNHVSGSPQSWKMRVVRVADLASCDSVNSAEPQDFPQGLYAGFTFSFDSACVIDFGHDQLLKIVGASGNDAGWAFAQTSTGIPYLIIRTQ